MTSVADAAPRRRAVSRGVLDEATWLRERAVPLANESDLRGILPLLRDAHIVGLGDITHGSHEPFAIKQQLIPLLVSELGFRVIALEAPFAEFEQIRDYVLTGRGDPAKALESPDYFWWDAQEILELIEWARAENERGLMPPVQIVGVDPPHPNSSIEFVLAALSDPVLKAEVKRRYECVSQENNDPGHYHAKGEFAINNCRAFVATVRPMLETAGASSDLLYAARLVEQGERALATYSSNRDEAMAENVGWFADRGVGRVVLWAHNEHVGKTDWAFAGQRNVSAGRVLAEARGKDYMTVATIALHATFWLGLLHPGSVPLSTIETRSAPPASEDDYATFFALAGFPVLAASLAPPLPPWLMSPHRIRFASTGATFDVIENLPERFDVVIYFHTITPSQLRHFPTR